MEEENARVVDEVKEGPHVRERVEQFIEAEGDRIRQETERVQSPIIAKARQEYKKRLTAFLEEERERIRVEAEKEAAAIISKAESEANAIIAQAQTQKQEAIAAGRTEAQTHAEQVIEEAKRQANMDREREVAEGQKQADAIVAEAKESAENLKRKAAEFARKTVEVECGKILAEAQANASSQAQAIISDAWRRAQQMLDSADTAYKVVRTQLQECIKAILEADGKMENATTMASPEGGRDVGIFEPADPQPVAQDKRA